MLGLFILVAGVLVYVGVSVVISMHNQANLDTSLSDREIEALTFFESTSEND